MPVNFSLTEFKQAKDKNYVYRTGLIFRAGNYPDRKFKISNEELKEAAEAFTPVKIDSEHRRSVFDGKIGNLAGVATSDDGSELYGTVVVPKALNDLLGEDELPVSCTWNTETKRLEGLALTANPRISDAAVFAAFSKHRLDTGEDQTKVVTDMIAWFADNYDYTKTNSGQSAIQRLHDIAAEKGAICDKSNKNSKSYAWYSSKEEAAALQIIHDMAVDSGAGCDFKYDYSKSTYSKEVNSKMDKNLVKKFFALFKEAGVEVELKEPETEVDEVAKLKAEIAALTSQVTALKTAAPAEKAEMSKEVDEVAKLKAELEAVKVEKLKAEGAAFAESLVKDGKVPPTIKEHVLALYSQIASDDANQSVEVKFSANDKEEKLTRLDAFKAIFAGFKATDLTKEQVFSSSALLSESSTGEDDVKAAQKQASEFAATRNKRK